MILSLSKDTEIQDKIHPYYNSQIRKKHALKKKNKNKEIKLKTINIVNYNCAVLIFLNLYRILYIILLFFIFIFWIFFYKGHYSIKFLFFI